MDQEVRELRLLPVAKELNVSYHHLYEELERVGLQPEKKQPNAKISPAAYEHLLKVFSKDRHEKEKATQLGLSNRLSDKEKHRESIVTPSPKAPPTVTTTQEKPKEKVVTSHVSLEGPKVITKIDPDKLETKRSARRRVKKTVEEAPTAPETDAQGATTVITEEVKAPEPPVTPSHPDLISLKAPVLPGTKVVGKVELPVEERVTKTKSTEEPPKIEKAPEQRRRPRKRIYKTDKIPPPAPTTERVPPKAEPERKAVGPKEKPDIEHEKSAQDRIREILTRMMPQPKTRPTRARHQEAARPAGGSEQSADTKAAEAKTIMVTEFISPNELAKLLNVEPNDILAKCLELGQIVSINQRLEADLIELISAEYGYRVQFISLEEQELLEEQEQPDDPSLLQPRPPVVTIMGHVDHGKTSLLDFIRQSNVVAGEKGGITQHIGAYEVTLENQKKITFLDTPGHEAFTAMRARGAKLTDIAVIVIAADDGVMPQTKEAISHAQAAGVPIIFAFNKMDKPGASADRIRQQLADMNYLVEEWGGKFQSQEISAKTGMGVNELLEKILLEAELLDLKANPNKPARGTVIEATKDRGKGYVANLLVQDGTLHIGDIIVAGAQYGRVRNMFNERGNRVVAAGPSTPVQVLGLEGLPQAGEKFRVYESEQRARELAQKRQQILREQGLRTRKHITLEEIGRRRALGNFKELNLIIKADVDGSVEALADALQKLSTPEINFKILHRAVGQITESDVNLALTSDAIIIGFQVRPSPQARVLAEREKIDIRLYSVIYHAVEELKAAIEGMLKPSIVEKNIGTAEVRQIFHIKKVGTVAGCLVTEGKVQRSNKVRVIRDGIVVFTGALASLKRFKDDVREVVSGQECGLAIKSYNDVREGDILEFFEEEEVRRKL
ncbi:MAG: translation initiation factor IF-2 [Chitinophagales bacterium]|nr:translation initiation factor IF-2 [Chitinophagales bacterium]MDW8427790.1 translation initiation factor IF-2 [Chitinophagales bacterium]